MAQIDKLKIRLNITSTSEDSLLEELLESAKSAIISRRYPFGGVPTDDSGNPVLEDRYMDLQLRIAVYLYNKRGAEGQIAHRENGIDRTYESADIPLSILREIVPYVGGFKK